MTIRTILSLILACLLGMPAFCAPAFPGKTLIVTDKGDTMTIQIKGDENFKYAVDKDGYAMAAGVDGWYYIMSDAAGHTEVSDIRVGASSLTDNIIGPKKFLVRPGSKEFKLYKEYIKSGLKKNAPRKMQTARVSGEIHALVILMQYPDIPFTFCHNDFNRLFNETDYEEDNASGSVKDYYKYASYGELNYISDVYGPFTTKFNAEYYGGNNSYGHDSHALDLAVEAVNNLPEGIDLSVYDNNADGMVDNVHIIFAGYGEEAGGAGYAIWSHEYSASLPINISNFGFAGYSCTPELRSNMGQRISRIGVICHELAHALGANDFYDVDYSENGEFEGTGKWDLMASGSWNDNGKSPANINPYVKAYDFGWCTPIVVNESGSMELEAYNDRPCILKIETPQIDNYYLLEYRLKDKFDIANPGAGILIYHAHPQLENHKRTNDINNLHPQRFYVECASNRSSVPQNGKYGDINSDGCPFPGSTGNTSFSASSRPKAFCWNGEKPGFAISDISVDDNCAHLNIQLDGSETSDPDISIDGIYYEGFENGISNFAVESIWGTDVWQNYPRKSLSTISDCPKPSEGEKAIMLYGGDKSSLSESTITSSLIKLSSDSAYCLSFYFCNKIDKKGGIPEFKLYVKNNNSSWIELLKIKEKTENWTRFSVQLPSEASSMRYRFSGITEGQGVFVDAVQIKSTGTNALVDNVINNCFLAYATNGELYLCSEIETKVLIFNIYGKEIARMHLQPNEPCMTILPPGIYVISHLGGVQKVAIR